MPFETQLVSVVTAPNIVFDQPIVQMPDPEMCLQLSAVQCFWDVYNEIHQREVSLCVYCTLKPERKGRVESHYPTGHFLFLTSNQMRDGRIQQELRDQAWSAFADESVTVYELSGCKFICLPKPGLIIYTNDKALMRTILSRLDSWWLKRVAMPTSLIEWKYVNQKAPYWGVRHFSPGDRTAPVHSPDGSESASQAIALTFEYTKIPDALQVRYLSNDTERTGVAPKLIKDVDSRTAQHISVDSVDDRATKITVLDARCLGPAVYAVLEWFDPVTAIRLEQIRHRRM
jgi:hypothetical protein